MAEERLTQDELALVLRRAAELDVAPAGSAADDRLPVAAVEAAAAEVGLPATAVRQAVAELRAGVLRAGPAGADGLVEVGAAPVDRAVVVEAGEVPFEPERALAEVGRWLGGQTFHRHRGRDGVEVWRVREDWVAGMQRKFDWSASVRLKGVREVVVRAVAMGDGALLRLEATLDGAYASAPTIGTVGGGTAGTVVGVGSTVALAAPGVLIGGVGAATAGIGALLGWRAGRSSRRRSRDRIADELAAELDRIATGRANDGALERLKQRAMRASHRGGRWA